MTDLSSLSPPQVDLTRLSARKLHAEIEKRDARHSETLKEVIAAGYGNLTGREVRDRAKALDYVCARHVAALDAFLEATQELDARRRWHGEDKPIRREA
jgi:hypothetical protein